MDKLKDRKEKRKQTHFRWIPPLKKNGAGSKIEILQEKRFGDLKIGFFSEAGFRNPGYE